MTNFNFTMRDLFEASVHMGHKKMFWNPLMEPYIYGTYNSIHIVDLQKTVPLLHNALQKVSSVVAKRGRVLFVGTKPQASQIIMEEAQRCGQYYINYRWLGGLFTNWCTVSTSIKRLLECEKQLNDENNNLIKKERMQLQAKYNKMYRNLGGIVKMGGIPDMIFVIDVNHENIAIKEANKMGIPVVAVVDTNADPTDIDYPIPGNDDSTRAIRLYSRLVADAVISGIKDDFSKEDKYSDFQKNYKEKSNNPPAVNSAESSDNEGNAEESDKIS